jgi:hypothetical protein
MKVCAAEGMKGVCHGEEHVGLMAAQWLAADLVTRYFSLTSMGKGDTEVQFHCLWRLHAATRANNVLSAVTFLTSILAHTARKTSFL